MPLPATTENEIREIEATVEPFHAALVAALVALDAGLIPSWPTIASEVRPRVLSVLDGSIAANGAPTTPDFLSSSTDLIMSQLEDTWNRAAAAMRVQIEATLANDSGNQGLAGFLALATAVAAGKAISRSREVVAAAKRIKAAGGRIPKTVLKRAAEKLTIPVSRRQMNVMSHMRMILRTETAKIRNANAAFHAERNGLAILVRDALIGDDDPCVSVDRRYATAEWLRQNPVAHPNCTREGKAVELPDGATVTLT